MPGRRLELSMMNVTNPRTRSLLRQAGRVAEAGKRAAAEKMYREIVEEAPDVAEAWLGLAQTVRDADEKESAFERALALDPENKAAIRGLAALRDPEAAQAAEWAEAIADDVDPAIVEPEAPVIASAPKPAVPQPLDESITASPAQPAGAAETLFCANHPDRETNLRCNRCGKPICSRCARRTPVGYRCRECVREQEDVFFSATPVHYLLAIMITLPMALLAGFFAPVVGFWVIFIAAAAGAVIGRVVFRLIGRRRGRWLPHVVAATVVFGAVVWLALPLLQLILAPGEGMALLDFRLIWRIVYAVIAASSAFYQVR
jgi:hypothetical protein